MGRLLGADRGWRAGGSRPKQGYRGEVFAERGFPAASMEEVALRCGVSKGLAYHYFESKEELALTALGSRLESLLAVTSQTEEHSEPSVALATLIDGLIATVADDPDVFRLYLNLVTHVDGGALGEVRERLGDPMEIYLDRIRNLFRKLGSRDAEIDAVLFRSALLGLCVRLALGRELPLAAIRARMIEMFAHPAAAQGPPR